ncbi:MAG: sigma-70 family RNA polymerase sigma factor [Pseudomonadota bacterium]
MQTARKILRRWFHRPDDIDDVIQTVCEKVLRSGAPPSSAYLSVMFRNAAIDRMRAAEARQRNEDQYAVEADFIDERGPASGVQWLEALELLESALQELSPLNRELFIRAYVKGQPRAEIACALDLRLSTVEKRLAKAREHCYKKVRSQLNDD